MNSNSTAPRSRQTGESGSWNRVSVQPLGMWSVLGALAICGVVALPQCSLAAESVTLTPAEEPLKLAIDQARGCLLKVECHDPRGVEGPIVLSAVVLDEEGYAVTVGLRSQSDRRILVRDVTGARHQAQWVATDDQTGVTLIKVDRNVARPVQMAVELPEPGSSVLVVGNPFGLSHSISLGIVSGLNRSVNLRGGIGRGLIQISAPIFPGDGGGLLADTRARMLGIVCTSLSGYEDREPVAGGIGFAIPASEVRRITSHLRAGQKVPRGYLGLTAENLVSGGVRVRSVAAESPAAKAGLAEGDVIKSINGEPVDDFDELAGRVEKSTPGISIQLVTIRDDREQAIEATVADRSTSLSSAQHSLVPGRLAVESNRDRQTPSLAGIFAAAERTLLGVHTQPVSESLAKTLELKSRSGVLVSGVVPGSPAQKVKLHTSDVIVDVNGEPMESPAQFRDRIRLAGPKAKILLGITREGQRELVEVTLSDVGAGGLDGLEARAPGPFPWSSELQQRVLQLEQRVRELELLLEKATPTTGSGKNETRDEPQRSK